MSTSAAAPHPANAERALEAYFDSLLSEPPAADSGLEPPARYRFFRLAGLRFALPEAAVAAVTDPPAVATACAAAGCRGWAVGQQPLRVVDTAALLLPADLAAAVDPGERRVVRLTSPPLALLCEAAAEAEPLDPDAVCWRGPRTRRPWLAGTWRARGCALIDVPGLVRMLPACDCSGLNNVEEPCHE